MAPRDTLTLHLHRALTRAIEPAMPAFLRRRQRRGKEHPDRMPERLGHAGLPRPEGPLAWLHGASVGETISLLPLIPQLMDRGLAVLMTSGTVTSAEIAAKRLPKGAIHQFAPIDAPGAARRFIAHWKPDLALFVESEIWPNLIREAHDSGVRLGIVNGRMSERSFRTWRKVPRTIGAILSRFDFVLAQSEADAQRFRLLGASGSWSAGNLKFDVAAPPSNPEMLKILKKQIGERPVFIAASTHPGEEEFILQALEAAQEQHPNVLFIIAPRHPERGEAIEERARELDIAVARRSQGAGVTPATELYIADTIGELGLIYRLGKIAFLGGSLIEHGGQNPIEPAKLGLAILHGPHVFNFTEVYAAFDKAGATEIVHDPAELGPLVVHRMETSNTLERMGFNAMLTATTLGGAVDRTLKALEPHVTAALERHR
jgi:3-deoxy-D-manno-octulosonic-acid transferase